MSEPTVCSACEIPRRRVVRWALALVVLLGLIGGCRHHDGGWHATDVTGTYPPLEFSMARAPSGKTVTAADFRGHVVMVYFGYSNCVTVCPVTLGNVKRVFERLGPAARRIRMLFVTVDPSRDTLSVLARYLQHFGPELVGLRGEPDQLTKLARRYRVGFSATPTDPRQPYVVSHSSAIYVFDGSGKARLLISSLGTDKPDLDGTAADLRRLVQQSRS